MVGFQSPFFPTIQMMDLQYCHPENTQESTQSDGPSNSGWCGSVFLGPTSGTRLLSTADQTLWGDGGAFGYHLAAVDDANGDGLTDLLVGAYSANDGAGITYLFSGGVP